MRVKWLVTLILCLLCWTSVSAPNYNAVKCDDKIMYAIFSDKFTEPIEVIYFLMNDTTLYKVTSNYENKVYLDMWVLKQDFKKTGHTFSDVIVIIHNHTKDAYFSKDDIDAYEIFKDVGFEGKYYLYVYRNKTIYELAERLR